MLTPKEKVALARLKKKEAEQQPPLPLKEIEEMDSHFEEAMGESALKDLGEFWKRWCTRFHILAQDNIKLINEVHRLRALLEKYEDK